MLRREPFFPRPADHTRMMPNPGPTLDPDSDTQGNPPSDNHHGAPDSHGEGGDQPRRRRRRRRGKGGGQGGDQGGQGGPQSEQHGGGVPPQHVSRLRKAKGEGPPPPPPDGRDEIFERTIKFADLSLREDVLRGITEAGFYFPTYIQARIIPVILSGRDVLGQAKTGTGKTAAFGLPMLSRIERGTPFQALVLVPTRELALQVAADLAELGRYSNLSILPVYGGQNIGTQANLLAKGPEIIVATPGRVMDMVERGYLHYRNVKMAVLDEVDRMLDIGFRDDIRRILKSCPQSRQTVFVSATISPEIESLARSYANNAEKIVAAEGSLTVSLVKQFHLPVEPWDKRALLAHLLTHEEPALTIAFCRMKRTVDEVVMYLGKKGIEAHAIHGDMYQAKRNKVIDQLRSGKLSVLIASDLASRGLDVEGITHVINYDLPEDPEIYVHRIGRTARAGRDGIAWSFVTPDQGALLTAIELFINTEIPKLEYPDFKPGPIPQGVLASRELDSKRLEVAKQYNRFAASAPSAVGHVASPSPEEADPTRFPGGVVPKGLPPKRMMGRVKTARSMKAAISQTLMPKVDHPPPQTPPMSNRST